MLKQTKFGSEKMREVSCVDKPLPEGAQGCALLQLRWVLDTRKVELSTMSKEEVKA